jgi:hypothetical protein
MLHATTDPAPAPQPPTYTLSVSHILLGVGALGLLAAGLVLGGVYSNWAYGDWTCMFKNCVQTSVKRSHR